jgi:hypothetical protein
MFRASASGETDLESGDTRDSSFDHIQVTSKLQKSPEWSPALANQPVNLLTRFRHLNRLTDTG